MNKYISWRDAFFVTLFQGTVGFIIVTPLVLLFGFIGAKLNISKDLETIIISAIALLMPILATRYVLSSNIANRYYRSFSISIKDESEVK